MQKELVLEYKGDKLTGILIKEDKEFMTLKLNSGYNINLKKSEVKIKSEKNIEVKEKIKSNAKVNTSLPKVAIIHTGGTIASKVDYKTGAVSAKFTPEELLDLYPELSEKVQLDANMIGNIFSGDMNISHWNVILGAVDKAIKNNPKGIIISHGTDTLAYTAMALQYAIKGLGIPIILVGAQRSSDRPSSDAYTNLTAAVDFILEKGKEYNRVGVCMHSSIHDNEFVIYDSINVRKMHSSRRDTFKQINYSPVATIENSKIKILRTFEKSKDKFEISKYNDKLKLGFFKSHPGTFSQEIKDLQKYDGVVLEGTGLGHVAVDEIDEHTKENVKNLEELDKLTKKTKVVIGTQCVYGPVNLNVYSYGRHIQETGVLGNYMNLTTECLFVRLAYCLSQKDFDKTWEENLEGFECRSVDVDSEF